MNVKIEPSWNTQLSSEFEKSYFKDLTTFVKDAYKEGIVYPAPKNIFRAFDLCPFERVRVVILGQDPYHGERQANGLAFAVDSRVALPPSLQNIYKEIATEFAVPYETLEKRGDLTHWAEQGVLLLNATLTVRAHQAGSHQGKGWEQFTDAIIRTLSQDRSNLVFMLWGNYARAKGAHIDRSKHLVLEAPHPSPLSAHAGFFGCNHFRKANEYLVSNNHQPIKWV